MAAYEAIIETCRERARPVVLTAVTAILGVLPIVFGMNIEFTTREITIGAPWWIHLSTAIVFGLGFATVLTLVVTPAALMAIANLAAWRHGARPTGPSGARRGLRPHSRRNKTGRMLDPTLLVSTPVIPVLTIERAADAVPLARALAAGGLTVIEVTLRTPAAIEAVEAITAYVTDCVVGVGTVTRAADIDRAVAAGAKFLVSPGTPPDLAAALGDASVPVLPGCASVSEAMALAARGFKVLKFFPAEASGGIAWLKSVAAPLPEAKFCPTGGIDSRNAASYLACPNVIAVGGSWVAPKDAMASGDFARITRLAREAAALRR